MLESFFESASLLQQHFFLRLKTGHFSQDISELKHVVKLLYTVGKGNNLEVVSFSMGN